MRACRAIVEVDCKEEGTPAATISNGANLRTGTIPVSFDPERRKMLWYYFVVTAMQSDEVVSTLLLSIRPFHLHSAAFLACTAVLPGLAIHTGHIHWRPSEAQSVENVWKSL